MSVQVLASTDICWYKTVETIDCPSDSWASIARVTPISDASNIMTDFFWDTMDRKSFINQEYEVEAFDLFTLCEGRLCGHVTDLQHFQFMISTGAGAH